MRITSPQKCVFKTIVTTAHSKDTSKASFNTAANEVITLDLNKVHRLDIEGGDSPSVVIEGTAWMCKEGRCQDNIKIGISARTIESKRHAIEFKKACQGRIVRARPEVFGVVNPLRRVTSRKGSG